MVMCPPNAEYSRWSFTRWVSCLLSAILVLTFTGAALLLQNQSEPPADTMTVRRVDTVIALPPPPSPPEESKPMRDVKTLSINAQSLGGESGTKVKFSIKPTFGIQQFEKIEQPKIATKPLDISELQSVDFPLIKVENLDSIPRAVSSGSNRFPNSLVRRGIREVYTKVEIIIDPTGKAFVKKIVDPVYPEMIDPIRRWVKDVQFTVPTKNGKPVQAIYLYTLHFVYKLY
jgi:periplasmic protein TonB